MKKSWMKKLSFVGMSLALLLAAGCGGGSTNTSGAGNQPSAGTESKPAEGAKTIPSVTLKFGHYFSTEDFRGKTAQYWADRVKEKSNGTINVEVYPSEQLVKGKEGFQATAQGTIDLYPVLTTYVGGQIPLFNFFNLPLPPSNYTDEVMLNIVNEAKPILDEEFNKNNVQNLGVINSTGSSELFFTKPVHTLEDMNGKKLRGAGGLTDEGMVSLGTSVTFMSAAEQYLALQTGTVDGMSTTYSSYVANKLYEVSPYWLRVTMSRTPYFLLMNKPKWDSLTPEQQQILTEATEDTIKWSSENFDQEQEKLMEEMKKMVKEEYVLPEEEWKRWYEKVSPIYEKYLSESGDKGKQLSEIRDKYLK